VKKWAYRLYVGIPEVTADVKPPPHGVELIGAFGKMVVGIFPRIDSSIVETHGCASLRAVRVIHI
jgi:hypothetical protein